MANIEIAGKDFMNYTDLRPKKDELSAIEKEKLADFVKALSKAEQVHLVKYIEDWHILQNEVNRRHDNADCQRYGAEKALNYEVF